MTGKSKYLDNLDSEATLKERVFLKLNKFPNISAKELCRLLKLPYYIYRDTIYSYRSEWKKSKEKDRQRLKSLSFHAVRFFGYVLKDMKERSLLFKNDNEKGLGNALLYNHNVVGGNVWFRTKAKNHMIVFKSRLGRIEWFETGRINCWVRKPASLGKMKQLLADAFYKNGIVGNINIFGEWSDTFRLKGFHLVLDTGERLPYAKIKMLKEDTGVVAVMGDISDPTGLELQVVLPDFREKQEELQLLTLKALDLNSNQFKQFNEAMKKLSPQNNTPKISSINSGEPRYIS